MYAWNSEVLKILMFQCIGRWSRSVQQLTLILCIKDKFRQPPWHGIISEAWVSLPPQNVLGGMTMLWTPFHEQGSRGARWQRDLAWYMQIVCIHPGSEPHLHNSPLIPSLGNHPTCHNDALPGKLDVRGWWGLGIPSPAWAVCNPPLLFFREWNPLVYISPMLSSSCWFVPTTSFFQDGAGVSFDPAS